MKLEIHPELSSFLPDVDEEDEKALEADIIACGGARDPIVVWSGKGIIIDGHRRYRICNKHGLPFKTEEMLFDSLSEAMEFMEKWQFMRRNMTPAQRALATQKMVQRRLQDSRDGTTKSEIVAQVAEATNRSPRSVWHDVKVAQVIEQTPKEVKEVAKELSASAVAKIAEIPQERQQEIAAVADKQERKKVLKEAIEEVSKTPYPKPKEVEEALETLAILQKQVRDLANTLGRLEDFKALRWNFTKVYDWLNSLKGK